MTRQKEKHVEYSPISHSLNLNNTLIKNVPYVKFLGFLLDKNVTFNNHLNETRAKLSKGIYALSQAAKVVSTRE